METAAERPPPTFDALPLSADIRQAIDALGYQHPTPVQIAVFEPATRGKSLVVQARTGTGKTCAFGLPIVDVLVKKSVAKVQALILVPTRELALQVSRELIRLAEFRGTKIMSIYGGAPMGKQIDGLADGAQVVVGTPGRVLDHLRRGTMDPSGVRIFVLDEADEMLSMGFAKELSSIVEFLPKERQGLYFSATIPPDIERLAAAQLTAPEYITLSSDQIGALEVDHFVYLTRGGSDKRADMLKILEVEDPESAILFCNTKDETEKLAEYLKVRGYEADWLNGDLEQRDRERVMQATREGKLRFLVATDVAARGIDISHLTHVINADFPENAEAYVHRTGRTGRAGRTGTAISLIGPRDFGNLYLLRLTYKIRPIEKQLPSAGELRTRAEADVVQFFVDAFAQRRTDPDDLALARRLLTHVDAERIIAGLLRDHLGARAQTGQGSIQEEAGEARRAKNPAPLHAVISGDPPHTLREGSAPEKKERAPRTEGPRRIAAPFDPAAARAQRPAAPSADATLPSSTAGVNASSASAAGSAGSASNVTVSHASASTASTSRDQADQSGQTEQNNRRPRTEQSPQAARPARSGEPRRRRSSSPHSDLAQWEPAAEADDDKPILAPLPGITVEGDEPTVAISGAASAALIMDMPAETLAQVYVNVGRRDGVRPSDIEQLFSDKAQIDKSSILAIRVRDRATFVSLKKEHVEAAVTKLNGIEYSGKNLLVERAREHSRT